MPVESRNSGATLSTVWRARMVRSTSKSRGSEPPNLTRHVAKREDIIEKGTNLHAGTMAKIPRIVETGRNRAALD